MCVCGEGGGGEGQSGMIGPTVQTNGIVPRAD